MQEMGLWISDSDIFRTEIFTLESFMMTSLTGKGFYCTQIKKNGSMAFFKAKD